MSKKAFDYVIPYRDADFIPDSPLVPEDLMVGHLISPRRFIAHQQEVKELYDEAVKTKIYIREYDEIGDGTCIEFGDKEGFIAVTRTGEIVSLLKNPTSRMKRFMDTAFANAIMVGGNRLDCYNCDGLGPHYCKRGFIPICKIKYNRYVDTTGMAKYYDCPDIIFYLYCGDPVADYWEKVLSDSYPGLEYYEERTSMYGYIPYVDQIQDMLNLSISASDYDFAHAFRDVVWGKWNEYLKDEFADAPFDMISHVLSDAKRLERWMQDYFDRNGIVGV